MATPETRFDDFNIHSTSYKTIGEHEIAVNVLIPKNAKPGKRPVFVRFHGGGLVQGDAMYPDWFAGWLVTYVLRNDAIVVLPNYRMLPEHSGKDIMEDLADFWTWFDTELSPYISSKDSAVEPDFNHLSVAGESAGGLLALQSVITSPQGKIKAVLCQYPMTDYLNRLPQERLFDGTMPPGPEIIDEHMSQVVPGTVVSSSIPWDRFRVSYALSAYKRWLEFYGTDKKLLPIGAVEDATYFPPTLIIHGEKDTAVDIEDSRKFIRKVGEVLGEKTMENLNLVPVKGADHGFDQDLVEEDTDWLKDGLRWLERKWLAKRDSMF